MTPAFSRLCLGASLPKWIKLTQDKWYKAVITGAKLSDVFRDGKKVWLKENTELPASVKSYWVYDPKLQCSMCISANVLSDFARLHVDQHSVVPATNKEQTVLDAYWQSHIKERIKERNRMAKKFKAMNT